MLLTQGHQEPHITPQKPPQPQQPDSHTISQASEPRLGDEPPTQPALRSWPHIPTPLPRPGASTPTGTLQLRQALWALSLSPTTVSLATAVGVAGAAGLHSSPGSAHGALSPAGWQETTITGGGGAAQPRPPTASGVPLDLAQAEQKESPQWNVHPPVGGSSQPKANTFPKKQGLFENYKQHLF